MISIIGTGPAGLMAADVISSAGHPVTIFEKRKSAGWKLLVAGSSGLNITNNLPLVSFKSFYTGAETEFFEKLLVEFSPKTWIAFIESLGIETFEGSSGKYFIREMKAAGFLKAWIGG